MVKIWAVKKPKCDKRFQGEGEGVKSGKGKRKKVKELTMGEESK